MIKNITCIVYSLTDWKLANPKMDPKHSKKWYNQIKPKQYKTISIFHGLYSTNYEKGFPGSPSSLCNCHCLKSDHFTCRLGSRFIQFHVNFTDKGNKHITENSYFSYMATLTWQQWRSYYNGAIYIIVIYWEQMLLFCRQNLQVHFLEWKCMKFIKSWFHDDVIKWKHFPCYWPFVRGTHRSPVGSPHKDQWHGALFSLICAWTSGWTNNQDAGDLRHYRAHYDVTVMPQAIMNVLNHSDALVLLIFL